jgi:hypothetical protein
VRTADDDDEDESSEDEDDEEEDPLARLEKEFGEEGTQDITAATVAAKNPEETRSYIGVFSRKYTRALTFQNFWK